MTDNRITRLHRERLAYVYVRQSTMAQVGRNTESTDRQYKLLQRAIDLGWPSTQVVIVDDDLGVSGAGTKHRGGFERMAAEVALGRVGIVLALEVSRLARNNSDWYRLLDLCSLTDSLIADHDGVYHPGHFNDRLVLGLKGTMSEAELHIIRARLNGGIRNKAARGELRRGLPIGYVWGDADGEVRFDPNEQVTSAVRAVFERFEEFGSARRVWLWFRSENVRFPGRRHMKATVTWTIPTYTAIHQVLTNPVYAGVYAYGKTKRERYIDEEGKVRTRMRHLPRTEWPVFIQDHHKGYISWQIFEQNQVRLDRNTRPRPHQPGGALREGAALLQGLATCGQCGRKLKVYYQGKNSTPGYHCPGSTLVNGRGVFCMRVGALRVDRAVATAFLETVRPAALQAALEAQDDIAHDRDAALAQHRLTVERATYEAQRAKRRLDSVEPENRLVARGLEAEWELRLRELHQAQAELARREQQQPQTLTEQQKKAITAIGKDLAEVWDAPTTTARDRKELLNSLLEEVSITLDRENHRAKLALRWYGGIIADIDVDLWRARQPPVRTDESTVALLGRLAQHYKDATIAGIFNRQGRRTATGQRFTANHVASLRAYRHIPCYRAASTPAKGELLTAKQAADVLDVSASTVHRWLNDGFIAGEQLTPGAPWRIRMNDELRTRFIQEEREGYLPMLEATLALGVSRQTVLQRVKSGKLDAVLLTKGRRKGLRIKVLTQQTELFPDAT